VKRGNATEEQIRKVIYETLARVTGKRVCLEAVTSDHVLKHREHLESEGRAPATVNFTVKRVLKRAFNVAIEEGTSHETRVRRSGFPGSGQG
jgi:hypothetical protein